MGQDKKVVAGQLNFIMARDIGQAFVTADVSEAVILSALEASIGPAVRLILEFEKMKRNDPSAMAALRWGIV
jgi:hypothetical protein